MQPLVVGLETQHPKSKKKKMRHDSYYTCIYLGWGGGGWDYKHDILGSTAGLHSQKRGGGNKY